MIGYGMHAGGINRCSGVTRRGSKCKRRGYVTDQANPFYCHDHAGGKP